MPTNLTPTLPQNDPEHWYVHVVFDVANSDAFANYLNEQVKIEQQNGMTSYEYFVDNVDQPTQAILIECFPNDAAQKNHLINHRPELFLAGPDFSLDIGQVGVLRRYEAWRRFDNISLLAVTDGLNRLFSNDIKPVKLARGLGLAAVDRLPGVKSFFMAHARGTVGIKPKLLEGQMV